MALQASSDVSCNGVQIGPIPALLTSLLVRSISICPIEDTESQSSFTRRTSNRVSPEHSHIQPSGPLHHSLDHVLYLLFDSDIDLPKPGLAVAMPLGDQLMRR